MGIFGGSRGRSANQFNIWYQMTMLENYKKALREGNTIQAKYLQDRLARYQASNASKPVQFNSDTGNTPWGTANYDPISGKYDFSFDPVYQGKRENLSGAYDQYMGYARKDPREYQNQIFNDDMAYIKPMQQAQYNDFLQNESAAGRVGLTGFDPNSGYSVPISTMERMLSTQMANNAQLYAQAGDRGFDRQRDYFDMAQGALGDLQSIDRNAMDAGRGITQMLWDDHFKAKDYEYKQTLADFMRSEGMLGDIANNEIMALMGPAEADLNIGTRFQDQYAQRRQGEAGGFFEQIAPYLIKGLSAWATGGFSGLSDLFSGWGGGSMFGYNQDAGISGGGSGGSMFA